MSAVVDSTPGRVSRAPWTLLVHVTPQVMPGTLNATVLKSLDKDRDRRYPTAGDLAADLNRFRDEQPVEARSPTIRYRFYKFARRNKVMITAASLVVAALVLGTIVSVWQAREAIVARQALEQFTVRLKQANGLVASGRTHADSCLLYTSPSPRDLSTSRMPSSA